MLTHVDDNNMPTMVDVSEKVETLRKATARSIVILPDSILSLLSNGDITTKKGPVFHTAIIAGTMAVKRTSELIPFCHPIAIEGCRINIEINDDSEVVIDCTVTVHNRTGVEMEALVGATTAALTVYDMCKAMSQEITIAQTRLLEKTGGKLDKTT